MDPIAIIVLVSFLILVAVAAIVPSMQRNRAEKAETEQADKKA
jgi:hypothetical protein